MASPSVQQPRTALPSLDSSTVSQRDYPKPLEIRKKTPPVESSPTMPLYSPPPPPPPPKDTPTLPIQLELPSLSPSQPQYRSMCDVDLEPSDRSVKIGKKEKQSSSRNGSRNNSSSSESSERSTIRTVTPTAGPQSQSQLQLPQRQMGSRSNSRDRLQVIEPSEAETKRNSAPPELDTSVGGGAYLTHISSKDMVASPQRNSPATLSRKESNKSGRKPTDIVTSPSVTASPHDSPSNRGNFMKRVGSYLKRANSKGQHSSEDVSGSTTPTPTPVATNSAASTISTGSSSTRGHHAYSFSSRSSATSRSVTPPSPGSPSSTIHEDELESTTQSELNAFGLGHSISASHIKKPIQARPGITWGPNFAEGGEIADPPARRRRSVSQDQLSLRRTVKKNNVDGAPVELMATFSFKSVEGAGLKSRRLSTSLPDEFTVDHCELDNEFKKSSILPGRRGQTIGRGATATVKLMFRKNDPSNAFYAVKEFRKRDREEVEVDYVKKVKSEYSIAKSLHHPNIVDTVRLCTHHGRWNHVMEYCQQGELYCMVEKGLFRSFYKLQDRLCFFKQLLRGVDYLHCHGVAHRDIKLENLLMNNDGFIKITDFGVSEVFCGEHPGLRAAGGECGKNMGSIRRCAPGICGSLPYIAPEVLEKNGDYDPRPLDVWSCAIVYLTMTYGGSPWSAARASDPNYSRFKQGWDDWLVKHPDNNINDGPGGAPNCGPIFSPDRIGSPALKRLILKMLHPDPDHRASIHDALNNSVIKGIECCSPESYDDTCHIDASTGKWISTGGSESGGKKKAIQRKHSHIPPKEHKTPKALQHRFDMGDGWN